MRDKDCSAQPVEAVADLPLPEDDFDRYCWSVWGASHAVAVYCEHEISSTVR